MEKKDVDKLIEQKSDNIEYEDKKLEINNFLHELGISLKYKECSYLSAIIFELVKNPHLLFDSFKSYSQILKEPKANLSSVITNLIKKVWDNIPYEKKMLIFYSCDIPTPRIFINQIYNSYIRKEINEKDVMIDISVEKVLFNLKIKADTSGFYYLKDIIIYLLLNGISTLEEKNKIYNYICDLHSTTYDAVYNSIKIVKVKWFSNLDEKTKEEYFANNKILENIEFLSFIYFEFAKQNKIDSDENISIIEFLYKLHIYPSSKGFKYLFSILKLLNDNSCLLKDRFELFKILENQYCDSYQNIDNSIKTAKMHYYNSIVSNKNFTKNVTYNNEILTNSQFIVFIYNKFKNETKLDYEMLNFLNCPKRYQITSGFEYICLAMNLIKNDYTMFESLNALYQSIADKYNELYKNNKSNTVNASSVSSSIDLFKKRFYLIEDNKQILNGKKVPTNGEFLSYVYYGFIKKNNILSNEEMKIFDVLYDFGIYPVKNGFRYIFTALELLKKDYTLLENLDLCYKRIDDICNKDIKDNSTDSIKIISCTIESLKRNSYKKISDSKKKELFFCSFDKKIPKNGEYLSFVFYQFIKRNETFSNIDLKIFELLYKFHIYPTYKGFKDVFEALRIIYNNNGKIDEDILMSINQCNNIDMIKRLFLKYVDKQKFVEIYNHGRVGVIEFLYDCLNREEKVKIKKM